MIAEWVWEWQICDLCYDHTKDSNIFIQLVHIATSGEHSYIGRWTTEIVILLIPR